MRLPTRDHKKLRQIIEGGVKAALNDHPEYVPAKHHWAIGRSLTKRILGQFKAAYDEDGSAEGGTAPGNQRR